MAAQLLVDLEGDITISFRLEPGSLQRVKAFGIHCSLGVKPKPSYCPGHGERSGEGQSISQFCRDLVVV